MSQLSKKTKRQILLLGVPLIMKIKSEQQLDIQDLKERLEYLKFNAIVPDSYTVDNLIRDTCICVNVSEKKYETKRQIRSRGKRSGK